MKLEAGKTYVFKDDAARSEFLRINPYNEIIIKGNGGLFEITSIDHDGDAETLQSEYINPKEFYLFKESKPFDISEYEFSDGSWALNSSDDDCVLLYECESLTDDGECNEIGINKQDAEAIAKHFKLI